MDKELISKRIRAKRIREQKAKLGACVSKGVEIWQIKERRLRVGIVIGINEGRNIEVQFIEGKEKVRPKDGIFMAQPKAKGLK